MRLVVLYVYVRGKNGRWTIGFYYLHFSSVFVLGSFIHATKLRARYIDVFLLSVFFFHVYVRQFCVVDVFNSLNFSSIFLLVSFTRGTR